MSGRRARWLPLGDGDDDAGAERDEAGDADERTARGRPLRSGEAHERHAGEEEEDGGDVVQGMVL